jgi:hypothetical protein
MGVFLLASFLALPAQVRADEEQVAAESNSVAAQIVVESDAFGAAADENSTGANPTHKQSSLIDINGHGLPEATVLCFCLMGDDQLLAGCEGSANEIRIFGKDGSYSSSIELAVKPEAINVAPGNTILVAGQGKLLRLSAEGEVLVEAGSPHGDALRENKAELREDVIKQHAQQAEMLPQMLQAYDSAIEQLEKQIEDLDDGAEKTTMEDTLTLYQDAKSQLADQFGEQAEPEELTEEKIAELVEASLQYKMSIASISATAEAVFIACRAPAGYGYDVWRTDADFQDGEKIITGLSGCCGQMDVQVCDEGVFVAENSHSRVRRFDTEGKSICDWGKSSEGVDGFGGCCNPMNLAFGADGSVYTAEDTTGRIKRYSSDGELLSVVGAADLVPGCTKVSIGVDSTGDQVYMLDISRNHVAVMSRVLPDPTEPIADAGVSDSMAKRLLRLIGVGR